MGLKSGPAFHESELHKHLVLPLEPSLRQPIPAKAPPDGAWLNPFGPLTTKAAKAAKLEGEQVKPYALLYTYSLIIALVCGTAGLPHILVRFYTNPDGVAAKRTTNGISRDIYFSPQSIEVWQSGRWVTQAPSWGGYGSWLEPGKSCMQPIPEPEGEHPWRIRYGVQEHRRGLMGAIDEAILKTAKTILFPIQPYIIVSPTILNGHAETNRADAPAHRTLDSLPAPDPGGGR